VQAQVSEAVARGNIALGLVQVYRALGGGWEIRLGQETASGMPPIPAPAGGENVPVPAPTSNPAVRPGDPEPQAPLPPPPKAS